MQSSQNFTSGPIISKLVRFALPVLGALVLQAMYGAVDLMVVGRFAGDAGSVSAVSTGSTMMNLPIRLFILLLMQDMKTAMLAKYLMY